jgi:hypothetical protein
MAQQYKEGLVPTGHRLAALHKEGARWQSRMPGQARNNDAPPPHHPAHLSECMAKRMCCTNQRHAAANNTAQQQAHTGQVQAGQPTC